MKKNGGFTIVELMVGLALALIIAFAVSSLYVDTQKSFSLQKSQTRLLEKGRYAIAIFQKMINQAGFRNEVKTNTSIADVYTSSGGFNSEELIKETSSVIYFRFTGNATGEPKSIIKCDGQDHDGNSVIINSLKKDADDIVCNNGTDDVTLIDGGVVDMLVKYGVDTNSDKIPDSYVEADDVTNWKNVFAAKYCIVLKSLNAEGNVMDTVFNYKKCDGTDVTPGDHNLYRRFDTTVYMRNAFE